MEKKNVLLTANKTFCQYCNTSIKIKRFTPGFEYLCPKCNSVVYTSGANLNTVLVLVFSTFILFFAAINVPILNITIFNTQSNTVLDSIFFLLNNKNTFSALIIFMTTVFIPLSLLILIFMIILFAKLEHHIPLKKMVGTYNLIKEWNMVDVYFIGVLISLIKFEELTTLRFDSGFIYIVIFIAMFYLTTNLFNAKDVILDYSPKKYDKNSLMKSSLFIFLAIIFVIPAFLLPIIPTFKFSVAYMNTLFDGIISFYKDGDYFISFVILFTSIIIPLVKISGVVIMIIMAKYNVLKRYAKLMTSYYNLTDGIGKYSMLDVYVVVVSGSFMQFDQLLRIESGAAVLPFTLVVVFTMMASKAFDTRLLWENK